MASIFAGMTARQFAGPLAVPAVYTAPGSGATPQNLRVIRSTPDGTDLGEPGMVVPRMPMMDVLIAALPVPAEGAALVCDGVTYRLKSWRRDDERLVWQLDLLAE